MVKETEEVITGGKALFFGDKDNKPCGVQIIGTDDLGHKGWVTFEVYDCNDLGLRRGGKTRTVFGTLANFEPEEIANVIFRGITKCGCPIKLKD